MKNQDINFNQKPISSEKIKSYQNFDAILNAVESNKFNNNSNDRAKTVFIPFLNPYFSIVASICLLFIIGIGLFLVQSNSSLQLSGNSSDKLENKTNLGYSITNKDLETAERLTASISQKLNLPTPKNGTAITTTILEENASPENASLQQVAQILKTEINKNSCKISSTSNETKYIAFVVNSKGQITDIEAQGCEQEAKKVLATFPKWKSGTLQGQHLSQRIVVAI